MAEGAGEVKREAVETGAGGASEPAPVRRDAGVACRAPRARRVTATAPTASLRWLPRVGAQEVLPKSLCGRQNGTSGQ